VIVWTCRGFFLPSTSNRCTTQSRGSTCDTNLLPVSMHDDVCIAFMPFARSGQLSIGDCNYASIGMRSRLPIRGSLPLLVLSRVTLQIESPILIGLLISFLVRYNRSSQFLCTSCICLVWQVGVASPRLGFVLGQSSWSTPPVEPIMASVRVPSAILLFTCYY